MAKRQANKVEVKEDYTFASTIERGSDEHAALLGLEKAPDGYDLQKDGWKLMDETAYGPNVTDRYLRNILEQKVGELTAEPVMPQSEDPRKPNYAQPIWRPHNVMY